MQNRTISKTIAGALLMGCCLSAAVSVAQRRRMIVVVRSPFGVMPRHLPRPQLPQIVWPRQSGHGGPTATTTHHTLATAIADAFEGVVIDGEIRLDPLLKACRTLEDTLRAVGQRTIAGDLHNNLDKIERLANQTPAKARRTVFDLLAYEKNMGLHPPHEGSKKRLHDPSAAMGLLWVRRLVLFNHKMYNDILSRDRQPVQAAMNAYADVLEPFHGWAARQLSTTGIHRSFPQEADQMFLQLSKHNTERPNIEATKRDMGRLLKTWEPLIDNWHEAFDRLDLDDNRRV